MSDLPAAGRLLRHLALCALLALTALLCRTAAADTADAAAIPTSALASASANLSFQSPLDAMPDQVFHIGLVAKTPSHPLYGVGDADCFSVDGVAGGNVSVQVGRSYGFQAMNLPLDYALYVSTSDMGAGVGQLSPHVAGEESLIWTVAAPSASSGLRFNSSAALSAANASAAANAAANATSGARPIQLMSPVGLMRLGGRLSDSMPANRSAKSTMDGASGAAAGSLSVLSLSLSLSNSDSARMAAVMEAEQRRADSGNTTASSTSIEVKPIAELYLQALMHPNVGLPIFIYE